MKMDIPEQTRTELMKQKFLHVYWRLSFFKASKDAPPAKSFFGPDADALFQLPWAGDEGSRTSLIEKLGLLDTYKEKINKINGKSADDTAKPKKQSKKQPQVEEEAATVPVKNARKVKRQLVAGKAKTKAKVQAKLRAKRRPQTEL